MKKTQLEFPVFRKKLKIISRLCTFMFIISFLSFTYNSLSAQQMQARVITGTVNDSKGQPVIGASVICKGTTVGANTNLDGKFQLTLPAGTKTIIVSFIVMKPQVVDIEGKGSVTVQLADETVSLEEIVIVGYGVQKKVTVTGAVTSVQNVQLINAAPAGNISTMLAGNTPGLLTKQLSGEPGNDATNIYIRGMGTYSGSTNPLIIVDGIEAQNYNNIDPNEIENISILKDASATAVYGVKGANGVLIITTKRGKTGRPQISFSSNVAINSWVNIRPRMDAYEYTSQWNEALKYDSFVSGAYNPKFTDADLQAWKDGSDPVFHPNTDAVAMMLKPTSFQTNENINITGGTDKVKYFISAGLFNNSGQFNNTNLNPGFFDMQIRYKRYNFRSNFDFNITKRLTASFNISDQLDDKSGAAPGTGGSAGSDDSSSQIRDISLTNPITACFYQGKIYSIQVPWNGTNNALLGFYSSGYQSRYRNYLNGSLRVNYDLDFITKGLSVHGTSSYQNYNQDQWIYYKNILTYTAIKAADFAQTGNFAIVPNSNDGPFSSGETTAKRRVSYMEIGFDYVRNFGSHNFSGKLLYNQTKKFDPTLQYVIPSGLQGLVGRVAYDYKGRYLLEYDFGYNGTENFAPGKRFGYFPAYSAGWIVSDESFFPKNKIVTFMKLRGSYGEVGNDQIGGNRFLYNPSSYTNYNNAWYWGMVGISSSGYGGSREGTQANPSVIWEVAKKTDVGLDIRFLNDKISITADYFYEQRDNILSKPNTIPDITGVTSILAAANIGKMKNSGFDGEIGFNSRAGNFSYWLKGNYTYAHNVIQFQDEVFNPYTYQMTTGQRNGQQIGQVEYGFYNTWLDVSDAYRPKNGFQNNKLQPGDPNYKDINGDGIYDSYDTGPIGYSYIPEITFGFSGGFNYKGFGLSLLFQGASNVTFVGKGNYISRWNSTVGVADYFMNAWTQEKYLNGDKITWSRQAIFGGPSQLAGGSSSPGGTMFNVDGSYVRLKNAELGYTFEKNNFLSKAGISSARIYLNATNLLTWAPKLSKTYVGVDPEDTPSVLGGGNNEPYPRTRAVNIGFNVTF
jgi:TonB-linked SusC/RagA family outer membrane protein